MFMNIPDDIAQRLHQLAQQEQTSIGELLKTLLDRYAPEPTTGTLAEMAQNARNAGLASSQKVDTSEHSREILNTDFADYLKHRMDNNIDGDPD